MKKYNKITLLPNIKAWREIFQLLEESPALWKVKSLDYKNKLKSEEAWDVLLEKYLEIDSGASLATFKNIIINVRTCYRRKLKKERSKIKSFRCGWWRCVLADALVLSWAGFFKGPGGGSRQHIVYDHKSGGKFSIVLRFFKFLTIFLLQKISTKLFRESVHAPWKHVRVKRERRK